MAIIGKFQYTTPEVISGYVKTLTLNTKIQFLPVDLENNDNRPNYRVVTAVGGHEIGAAWIKESPQDGGRYISVQLDDPSFAEPLRAILRLRDEGDFDLIWTRQKR